MCGLPRHTYDESSLFLKLGVTDTSNKEKSNSRLIWSIVRISMTLSKKQGIGHASFGALPLSGTNKIFNMLHITNTCWKSHFWHTFFFSYIVKFLIFGRSALLIYMMGTCNHYRLVWMCWYNFVLT
jgi:hypothetical protein